jgi:hypothetical protein
MVAIVLIEMLLQGLESIGRVLTRSNSEPNWAMREGRGVVFNILEGTSCSSENLSSGLVRQTRRKQQKCRQCSHDRNYVVSPLGRSD